MTVYLQLILFSSFVGLVWLIKASPVVRYYLKFSAYYGIVMVGSLFLIPVFIFHPFSVHNFVIGSHCFRWITHLIGVKWIIQNPDYLESDEPCIIVSNHQSSLDVLGLFQIWPKMGKCTVIARNAVFWVWPMGFAAWLAGLIFIPRAKSKADRAKTIINDVADQLTLTQVFVLKKRYFYLIEGISPYFMLIVISDLVATRALVHTEMNRAFKDINFDLLKNSNYTHDR
ncbi:1-acyl-sn-glycerol-3-phosphate acyltransferase alpha-like [Dendroctonus ponderosae]|uniref:1-acyl-sn-glycerol-3-phosphate acyltransferase alpha-like n=1 Tax=Dendroctonus ponderosae TaxID=77166 RepID=UPI0020350C5A|nr:1-acyl-sn-glycerol-3-phosphate acyltransferase alpha-like [Dendroctonus ponderosae]